MKVGLFQSQKQHLALTNQLRQAIELLQYSTMDLSQFIIEQATDNPIIEIEEPPMSAFNEVYSKTNNTNFEAIDMIRAKDEDIRSYLQSQLIDINIEQEDKDIVNYLILNVDDKGYITDSLEQIAIDLNCHSDKVKENLSILQQFEPAGVGATSIQESLLLQLSRITKKDNLAKKIVQYYLEDLATKKWERIAKECNASMKEVKQAFKVIQSLSPNPASSFGEKAHYIIPDFQVTISQGNCIVTLNDHLLPKLNLNNQYGSQSTGNEEVMDYIKIQMQHYRWLTRSISQRKQTLQSVMEEIIDRQQSFFKEGPSFIAPMTMRGVAERIEIHESTVSRAVKNKYVQTSHGVYPLKTFFTSKIKTTNGEDSSSFVVKKLLAKNIAEENKAKPLSDQAIVQLLLKKGITISRRTVAKYRLQLGIPSSNNRKER